MLDNLEGSAGQAIQGMNLMLGFPETTAIDQIALFSLRKLSVSP